MHMRAGLSKLIQIRDLSSHHNSVQVNSFFKDKILPVYFSSKSWLWKERIGLRQCLYHPTLPCNYTEIIYRLDIYQSPCVVLDVTVLYYYMDGKNWIDLKIVGIDYTTLFYSEKVKGWTQAILVQ